MMGVIEAPITKMMKAYPDEFKFMRHQTKREKLKIELSKRSEQLLMQIRDAWFPNEEKPMPLDEFIYVLCCHIIYNKLKRK